MQGCLGGRYANALSTCIVTSGSVLLEKTTKIMLLGMVIGALT